MASQDITIIGAGNLAWHLAPALDNAGYVVRHVYNRNLKKAKKLAERLYQAEASDSLDFSKSSSTIFIIAISDEAIEELAQEIALPEGAFLFHTSGASSIGVLNYAASDHIGVFYPLQTFSKSRKVNFQDIPIFIEAETDEAAQLLATLAKAISKKVIIINSAQRKQIHLAAVFASNFVNHCLHMSSSLMKKNKLDFEWMKPLVIETVNKALEIGPEAAQTGPAKRHDFRTLDAHLELIEDDELQDFYRIISQHIVDTYPQD